MFCGVFDGHGPWGHFVAKRVRELVPSTLLCNWQENVCSTSVDVGFDPDGYDQCDIWRKSYFKTYAAIDQELKQHTRIDSFCSGSTASTIVKQVN